MRKIFFAAIISLVTIICVSATIAEVNAADNHSSSVTANIAGVAGDIDFDTRTLVIIYNMMPQNVKDLCITSYKHIAPMIEKNGSKSFTYQGVRITPIVSENGMDLKFSCGGHSILVENYSKAEFDAIFGI